MLDSWERVRFTRRTDAKPKEQGTLLSYYTSNPDKPAISDINA